MIGEDGGVFLPDEPDGFVADGSVGLAVTLFIRAHGEEQSCQQEEEFHTDRAVGEESKKDALRHRRFAENVFFGVEEQDERGKGKAPEFQRPVSFASAFFHNRSIPPDIIECTRNALQKHYSLSLVFCQLYTSNFEENLKKF